MRNQSRSTLRLDGREHPRADPEQELTQIFIKLQYWHEEQKQKHTESRGTGQGTQSSNLEQEVTQIRSTLIAGGTKACRSTSECSSTYGFQEHPLKGPIYRTKPYIQEYAHWTQLDSSFVLFLLWSLYHCLIACKYSVKIMQRMNGIFVNMKRMKILSYNWRNRQFCQFRHVFNNQNSTSPVWKTKLTAKDS